MKKLLVFLIAVGFSACAAITDPENVTDTAPDIPAIATVSAPESTATVTEPPVLPEEKPPDFSELDGVLDKIAENLYTVGMSVAVFKGGDIIYKHSFGYADKERDILANEDTKYRVASVSKTVSMIGMYRLIEGGKFTRDTAAADLLGFSVDGDNATKVSVRHLLTHTSGLRDYEGVSFSSLAPVLNGGRQRIDIPGRTYNYNNFAAGLVGCIVENVSGMRFGDFMDAYVFDKLDMDAGYLRTRIADTENLASMYKSGVLEIDLRNWTRTDTSYSVIPLGSDDYVSQCELIISAKDLAVFGQILSGAKPFLSADSLGKIHEVFVETPDFGVAEGLRVYEGTAVPGRTIYGHPGQAFGIIAGLYYDRKDNTGVSITTNGCSLAVAENSIYTINDKIIKTVYSVIDGTDYS